MRKFFACAAVILSVASVTPAFADDVTAPDAPQYQSGTTTDLGGATTGTALNGSQQLTVPVGNGYVYGQNNSTSPSPTNPGGSYGASAGVGWTFQ